MIVPFVVSGCRTTDKSSESGTSMPEGQTMGQQSTQVIPENVQPGYQSPPTYVPSVDQPESSASMQSSGSDNISRTEDTPSQVDSTPNGVNLVPEPDDYEIKDINDAKRVIVAMIGGLDIDHNQKRSLNLTNTCRKAIFEIHPAIYSKMNADVGFDVSDLLLEMLVLREAWLRGDSLHYGNEMKKVYDRENSLMSYCLGRDFNRLYDMYWE
jgi:hypothetical protein